MDIRLYDSAYNYSLQPDIEKLASNIQPQKSHAIESMLKFKKVK